MIDRFNGIIKVNNITFDDGEAELSIASILVGDELFEEACLYDAEFETLMVLVVPSEMVRGVLPGDEVVVAGVIDYDEDTVYAVEVQSLTVNNLQDYGITVEDEDEILVDYEESDEDE